MDAFTRYLYMPFEHRTSKDGFAALSQCLNRQKALFDVGRWMFDVGRSDLFACHRHGSRQGGGVVSPPVAEGRTGTGEWLFMLDIRSHPNGFQRLRLDFRRRNLTIKTYSQDEIDP
jgi:hypothetical protein